MACLKSGLSSKSDTRKPSFPLLFTKSKGLWLLATRGTCMAFPSWWQTSSPCWSESTEESILNNLGKRTSATGVLQAGSVSRDHRTLRIRNTTGWIEKNPWLTGNRWGKGESCSLWTSDGICGTDLDTDSETRVSGYESQFYHLLAWANYLAPLWLSFLICKIGIITVFTSEECCED